MKDLVKMFPDATKTTKRPVVEYGANDNEFGAYVTSSVIKAACIALLFAVSLVVSAIVAYFKWIA